MKDHALRSAAFRVLSLALISAFGCPLPSPPQQPSLPSDKEITQFAFMGFEGNPGTIDNAKGTIAVALPMGTSRTSLVAIFTTSGDKVIAGGITQVSGVTLNDFTNPISYRVLAKDGSMKGYVVTVGFAGVDATNRWKPAGIYGKLVASGTGAIPGINGLAVSPDGSFLVAASNYDGGIWIIGTSDGSLRHVASGWGMGSVCIDNAGKFAYGINGPNVCQVDIAAGTAKGIYSLPNPNTRNFESIAIDGNELFICTWDFANNTRTVIRMDTAGNISRTLISPYFNNTIHGMAVGDRLYMAQDGSGFTGVVGYDKVTAAALSEIYYSNTAGAYQNVTLNGGTPMNGDRNPGWGKPVCYVNQQGLYVNFGNQVIDRFDPSNYTAPFVASYGNSADFSRPWEAAPAVDNAGEIFIFDRCLVFIKELISGRMVYSRPPQPGEFLRCTDMTMMPDGRIYLVDQELSRLSFFKPADDSFQNFGTPGWQNGQLNWPAVAAADAGNVYCGASWSLLRYDTSGNFKDQSPSVGANPHRLSVLSDGRLLLWGDQGPPPYLAYTYDSSWTQAGPFLQFAPFDKANDISLCLFPDGTMYCAVWGNDFASFGTLSNDLSSYTEIWNSSGSPEFSSGNNPPWDRYRIAGIAPGPGTDIWVCFQAMAAVVRFDVKGNVLASLSLNDASVEKWTPFRIAAYAKDPNGWWGGFNFGGLVEYRTDHSLYVFDVNSRQLKRFAPQEAPP